MTVRVYSSSDASAPTLNGTAGTLIALLDACLVNGYGAKASSGWTKSFSGTNLAAYKQPTGSNGFYLRIDDTGTNSSRAMGYETMSDVNTGTGPFPSSVQLASPGGYICKSSTADSTARAWLLICNGPFFYLFVNQASAADWATSCSYCFGDIQSVLPGDAYATIISVAVTSPGSASALHTIVSGSSALTTVVTGHWLARSFSQAGSSVTAGKISDGSRNNGGTTLGSGGSAFPHPIDGGLYVAPVWVTETPATAVRGTLPGIWNPLHNARVFAHGDTWTPTGDLSGKTLMAVTFPSTGQALIETSNTW